MSEEVQEVETPTTALTPPPEPPAETLPVVEAEAQETPPAVEGEEPKKPRVSADDPLISTITGLRAKNRDLNDQIAQAKREAADAKALAESLGRGETERPRPTSPPALDEAEIDRRAEQKLFMRDLEALQTRSIREFGAEEFKKIDDLVSAYGVDASFVGQVLSVDKENAHQIFHELAYNPDLAKSLVNMDPIRRIRELTVMSIERNSDGTFKAQTEVKPAAPQPKQVSRAPAPPPSVQPTAHKSVSIRTPDSDKMSDDEWSAAFDADTKNQERYLRR